MEKVSIGLSESDLEFLDDMAEETGLTRSEIVRRIISTYKIMNRQNNGVDDLWMDYMDSKED